MKQEKSRKHGFSGLSEWGSLVCMILPWLISQIYSI